MIINVLNRLIRSRKAQSLSEYALLIGIVAAALLSMHFFIKLRTQAILFDNISEFGNPAFNEEINIIGSGKRMITEFTTEASTNSLMRRLEAGGEETNIISRSSRTGTINLEER